MKTYDFYMQVHLISFCKKYLKKNNEISERVVIHYLKNKVGVVDFANAQGLVMF